MVRKHRDGSNHHDEANIAMAIYELDSMPSAETRAAVKTKLMAGIAKDPDTGCWNWQRAKIPKGYGAITINWVFYYTHRLSYWAYKGPITDGLWVLHRCGNATCVNPKHLYLGDVQDNANDMVAHGRSRKGQKSPWVSERKGSVNPNAKLNEDAVRALRMGLLSDKAAMEKFGVSDVVVWRAKTGDTWKHVDVPPVPVRRR